MKLTLAIVHLDMVVENLELEPGEYSFGRSTQNNIVVQHFSLDPEHGKLFFEEGQWFFEDFKKKRTSVINNAEPLNISSQISFATAAYVERSQTKFTDFSTIRGAHQDKLNKRLAIAGGLAFALLLLTVIGYQSFRSKDVSVSENYLLSRVRDKIVEFENIKDSKALEDLKSYANLKDSDFKESNGFCTGFLVGPNIVLTAGHCLLGRLVIDINNDFYLKTSDGKKHQIKQVLGFDVKRDFLFLKMEGMEDYGHLKFATDYHIEQKVYTVGNVHGEGIAIRDGIISSESADLDEPDVKFIRYSAGTSPGNSGGPLVDENGDVVALVFASTNSENFNLGTSSKDLVAAYEKFVDSDQPQNIHLIMKRVLNFKAPVMLQALSLPYLPQFDEYPEIAQKFNEVAVDIEVPIDFSQVNEAIITPINTKVIEAFEEVQGILKSKNEVILDWKSFVTKRTPAVLPSQFDTSQSQFVKINDRYYPLVAGLIDSPSKADFSKYLEQLTKENKFDFQSYGYNIRVAEEKVDLLPSDVFYKPKGNSGVKNRLINLSYGTPYSQLLVLGKDDVRTKNFFGLKLFMKNFISQSGVIFSAVSRFIRPQAMKDFTIKSLNIDNEKIEKKVVKDQRGRVWNRSRFKIFESIHIVTYCKELPSASLCIGRVFNVYNEKIFQTIESNFRQFILSHLLINPYFWEKEALLSFIGKGKNSFIPLMKGIELKSVGKNIRGKMALFPFQFEIPNATKVESLRLQTGLYGSSKKSGWTGYGVDWVQREKTKDLVCGLGLEVFQSQSAFVLNFLRDRRKQEKLKKIKGDPAQPLPGIWYRPFRGLKQPFQIYGYCAPLEEDPRVAGQYFVDFKNAKPLKYPYKIAQ